MKKFISILLSAAMALSALSAAAATDSNKVFDFSFKNVPAATLTYTQAISCGEDKLNCWLKDSSKTVSIGDYSAVTGESGNSLNMTNVKRLRPMDGNLSGSFRLSMRFYVPGAEGNWGFGVNAKMTNSSNTDTSPALFGVLGGTDFCLRTGNGEWGIATIVGDITQGWNKIDYELMRSSGLANLYINDVQVASNVAANTNSDMTALLTSDKVIEYIDIHTKNAGSAYMDSISIEMLNDYSVLSEGMTYTEPKIKLAFDSAVDSLTAEDITITNNNIHRSFKPSAVSKLNESAYEITVPEKEVRPFTEYSIGIQKSGIVKDKIFTTEAIQTKNTLFGCNFDTTDEQNKFYYNDKNGKAAVEAVDNRGNAIHMTYTRQAADNSSDGYKEEAPNMESVAFAPKINSKFTLETDIMREDKASSAAIQIRGKEAKIPVLKFDVSGEIYTINGKWQKARVLGTYETNKWYHVRIDIDPTAGKETITVTDTVTGNVFMAANTDMFQALTDVSNVGVNIWGANTVDAATGTYIDNVEISDYTVLNNKLDINKLMLKQGSTVIKDYCQLQEDVPVQAVVNITSDKDETYSSVKVILAEYNNGRLVGVYSEDALLNKDESGTASHTLDTGITTANCAGRSVKAFLWDSFDSMKPYVEAVAFNGKD